MRPDDIESIIDAEMADDPVFTIEIVTPLGSLRLMGEFEVGSDSIVVRGLHIGVDPAVEWGWSKLRMLGRPIAEKLHVDEISIHGAVRTTGANPGRRPRVVRLTRAGKPAFSRRGKHS